MKAFSAQCAAISEPEMMRNFVANVAAIMPLLPAAGHEPGGPVLALASTLADKLLVISSLASVIVLVSAARGGIRIRWTVHARLGLPVGQLSLGGGWPRRCSCNCVAAA